MFLLIVFLSILGAALYAFSKIDSSILLAIYDKYYPNKERLANSIVWIVGSSSGIGEELAYEFARLKCKIILTSTSKSKLDRVKRNCLNLGSLKDDDILVLPYDISDLKSNRNSLETVLEKFGDIDILVNNAARINSCEDVLSGIDNELEIDKKIFNINYFGNIYLAKLVVNHWQKTNSSGLRILSVTSSAVSILPVTPYFSTYAASKIAINNFYRDLKLQYPKIQISNCIPGPIDSTLMAENALGNRKIRIKESQRKMDAKRCAHLMVVGIANRLFEFIVCEQSWLSFCFVSIYFNYEIYSLMCFTNAAKYIKDSFIEDDETKL